MKTYTIIAGVNGTGKSSFTGAMKSGTADLGAVIDVDKITAQLGGDLLAGGKAAIRRIEACLEKGACFTQETTLSGRRTAETARRAKESGYHVRLFYIGLDTAEESERRIANRVARGGHNIDHGTVSRRFAARWEALAAVLPYCDEATFYDNDNGFRAVAAYQAGEIVTLGDEIPRWVRELQEALKPKRDNNGK